MIRPVLRMGDRRLLARSAEVVEFDTAQLHALIQDMFDTMRDLRGAGLAAPQTGVGLRVVIFGFSSNDRYPQAPPVPETILINPEITPLSARMDHAWEGCLSVPGMRGVVARYSHIRYRGVNQYGKAIDREVTDFHARVVQHECDHLDGILYPMRVMDMSQFGYSEVLFPEQTADE